MKPYILISILLFGCAKEKDLTKGKRVVSYTIYTIKNNHDAGDTTTFHLDYSGGQGTHAVLTKSGVNEWVSEDIVLKDNVVNELSVAAMADSVPDGNLLRATIYINGEIVADTLEGAGKNVTISLIKRLE